MLGRIRGIRAFTKHSLLCLPWPHHPIAQFQCYGRILSERLTCPVDWTRSPPGTHAIPALTVSCMLQTVGLFTMHSQLVTTAIFQDRLPPWGRSCCSGGTTTFRASPARWRSVSTMATSPISPSHVRVGCCTATNWSSPWPARTSNSCSRWVWWTSVASCSRLAEDQPAEENRVPTNEYTEWA